MNREEFVKNLEVLNIKLTDEQLSNLDKYKEYLKEYNSHTNLTTIVDDEGIYLKHFYDSLTITKMIDLSKYETLIDVGTGAGFPGMVIAITYPNLKVTLLDSNNKKTKFLSELKDMLNLTNVTVVNERSEEFALSHLESFDVVTSRAVANLRVLTELCLPMVKKNGFFVPLKANVDEEINESTNILKTLNGKLVDRITFNLPKEEATRNILKIEKIGLTPKGYPRAYNKIKKG